MRKHTKNLDWKDIEGKTIKSTQEVSDSWGCEVKIIFTDGLEVFIVGGSSSGHEFLQRRLISQRVHMNPQSNIASSTSSKGPHIEKRKKDLLPCR